MTVGQITLNGITDKQLARVLEFKVAHEGQFTLNFPQIQQAVLAGNPPTIVYNNFIITWNGDLAMKVVLELLASLLA